LFSYWVTLSSQSLNQLKFSYLTTVILNKHTRLVFKFTINFFSNTINSLALVISKQLSIIVILQYYMFNLYLSQILYISFLLVCVTPDRCAVEYLSDRKVTKSMNCRCDVNYIEQFLQVCTFFTGITNLSSVTGFIVYSISL